MINCAYCGSGNPEDSANCIKCGAPRAHAFPEACSLLRTKFREYTAPAIMDSWPVQGYDSSAWNGDQNGFVTINKSQFGMIRAGYGNLTLDPKLNYYRTTCANAGIVYGLYWYARVGENWLQHANSFYQAWKDNPGKLPPVFDFEYTTLDKTGTGNWIYSLLHQFENLSGKKPMIYTSPGWWNTYVARTTWAKNYRLWVAHWTTAESPILPYDWTLWTLWQHSADNNGKASEYGFLNGDPDLDLNRYNGSIDAFNFEFGTNIQPLGTVVFPPEIPEIIPQYCARVTATALNVRSLPSALSRDLGDLKYGDILPVTEESDGWCHIEGWVSKAYLQKV